MDHTSDLTAEERTHAHIRTAREVARRHGYAIGVHGSLGRDLDLIAAPWIESCSAPDDLVNDLEDALDMYAIRRSVVKPHGRIGFILRKSSAQEFALQPIDLSVLPLGAAALEKSEKRRERLEEALRFYADSNNYLFAADNLIDDEGKRAREALEPGEGG